MSTDKPAKPVVPLEQRIKDLDIVGYETHMFICGGPNCCSSAQGDAVWQELKAFCAELNQAGAKAYRTKVHCLRICQEGPIGVVYPGGYWYKNLNCENAKRVLREHAVNGKPVKDLLFAKNKNL